MKQIHWQLYLVVDVALAKRPLEQIVREAAAGGVTIFQLRHKSHDTQAIFANAQIMRKVTRELGLPLIINDRVDVALAVDADGVHLGPEDLPVAVARSLLGTGKIIGASTGTVKEAHQAVSEGADYLGVGAVFRTQTKADAGDPIGLAGLREIVQAVSIPVVGIGGINRDNIGDVLQTGAAGAAIISAVLCAPDIKQAARDLATIKYPARLGAKPSTEQDKLSSFESLT